MTVRRQAAAAAETLPELARRAIGDLLEQLCMLDERIGGYDREIEAQARLCEPAQRLMKIRGIGPTTALAIVATVGNVMGAGLRASAKAAESPPDPAATRAARSVATPGVIEQKSAEGVVAERPP